MKIGSKILGLGILIFLLPTDIVGILSAAKATEGLTKLASENVDNMARSVANYIELRLQGDKRFVVGLSADDGIGEFLEASLAGKATKDDTARMNAKLASLKGQGDLDPLYDAISIIARDGTVVGCSLPPVVGMNVGAMPFFTSAVAGQPTIGQVVIDGKQPPNAGITSPVKDETGAVIGVCGVYVNPVKNLTELSQYDLGKSGYFMVVDKTGLVVFHPDEKIMLIKNVKEISGWESLARGVLTGKPGGATFAHEGARRGAAFFPVPSNGWIVMLSTIGFALVALILLARSISKPLGEATSYAKLLAEGDLAVAVDARHLVRKDEIGELAKAFKDMVGRLGQVAANAQSVTGKVSSGSDSISATAQQLSQGSTEQASSAEEISASVAEMSATIKQNADNARTTEGMASKAAKDAERGNMAVANSVEAMKKIVEKISIIENISSQTNLLALNAAIEPKA